MSHDPANFVNPGAFDPENFNPANNPNKFALQVFGQGPRNCIGMRWVRSGQVRDPGTVLE